MTLSTTLQINLGTSATVIAAATGTLELAGQVPVVTRTDNQTITPVAGTLQFSGQAAVITRTENQTISPITGTFQFAGQTPTVRQETTLVLSVQQAARLEAVFRLHGLIDPLTVSSTGRSDGTVIQTISGSGPYTVTTTNLPSTPLLTADLVDDLARWYGLIDPMVESETTRSDGTLTQTVASLSGVTTMERQ